MLVFLNPEGHIKRIVRTNPILAVNLTVAPDGSVWALVKKSTVSGLPCPRLGRRSTA